MWGCVALGDSRSGKMSTMNIILVTGELLNLTSLTGRKEKRKEVGNKNSCRKTKQNHKETKLRKSSSWQA